MECIFGPTLTAHIVYRFHITPLVHDPSVFLVPSARVPTSPRSPTSVASDAHAAAPRPEELIKAFDRSTLEPDFVWIQLDAGPDVTAYLHASLIRYIIHFKVSPPPLLIHSTEIFLYEFWVIGHAFTQ